MGIRGVEATRLNGGASSEQSCDLPNARREGRSATLRGRHVCISLFILQAAVSLLSAAGQVAFADTGAVESVNATAALRGCRVESRAAIVTPIAAQQCARPQRST